MGGYIVHQVGKISTGDVTSLASKFHFYVKNKMAVDLSMSNWHVIDKFEGNAHFCRLLFNFSPPIVCPHFSVNSYGFPTSVWNLKAKLMITTSVSVFDVIDHAVASFEINLKMAV